MTFRAVGLLLVGIGAGGCARRALPQPRSAAAATPHTEIAGVWDGVLRETLTEGFAAGDSRVERQEWHLDQKGPTVSGYYLASLTYTSGDGRPYVCSRQPSFSAVVRFDVSGRVQGNAIDIEEVAEQASDSRCSAGRRPLARYRAQVQGDVLLLTSGDQRQTLYRNRGTAESAGLSAETPGGAIAPAAPALTLHDGPRAPGSTAASATGAATAAAIPADVSGIWVWEHRGSAPTGDEKQEREEWHVDQQGDRLTGYYDRVVREISTDGHAFKCSMDMEFEIATRYRIHGEVRGNQIVIYENSFEVLEPNACDNGKRRLDAYEGQADGDEVRLVWGVGGQILRRPRPDVPTQRF